jgi:hypothetical protein
MAITPRGGSQHNLLRLLFAAALVLLLFFGLYPWAFNIGGRFTPWTVWSGYGKLQASTGAAYGLYVRFWLKPYRGPGPGSNLQGTAVLCTPQGISYSYRLSGEIKNAWSTTEGKTTHLYLHVPDADKQKLLSGFELHGVWQNGELVVDDKGSMRRSFRLDGSAAGEGSVTVSPSSEHAAVTLAYGTQEQAQALCRALR